MKSDTMMVTAGRHPNAFEGAVNTPVVRTSTVVAETMADWDKLNAADNSKMVYGRLGTPTTRALEEAIAKVEGAAAGFVYPSGLAACVGAILPFVGAGDHILMTDNVYGPVRRFTANILKRMNVETTFFRPGIGRELASMMRPNTRLVYLEAPGSLSMEMQDVPLLAGIARAGGAKTVMDNTWATPLYFRPLEHGVDVSIQSATKYIVGHSDVMMGLLSTNAETAQTVKSCRQDFRQIASPDDIYLTLRGLRTMHVRLERHWKTGMMLAEWIRSQPEVEAVMHPALPEDPGHALWKRDFDGACGLFTFVFKPMPRAAEVAFIDEMPLFSLGASWGGYESLILPIHPEKVRVVEPWQYSGPAYRIHAGLEDPQDLLDNLKQGFAALRRAL